MLRSLQGGGKGHLFTKVPQNDLMASPTFSTGHQHLGYPMKPCDIWILLPYILWNFMRSKIAVSG